MRIQDSSSLRELDKNTKSSSPMKKIMNSFFADELDNHEEEVYSYQDDIKNLRTEIEKAGNHLSTEPTLMNFKRFRDLLSKLAKKVSAEAYRLDKFCGTAQNPRYFEIITVIDREADNLYNLIVKENRDSMAITAKVIGIKGLVVDLVT
ncbi:MAG: YaaR family protein [Desulfuromonadales bacterium]